MKKVVVADNVTRTYGKFTAVDGVSFHVAQGELVALLGSNGAGKTSLLEVSRGARVPTMVVSGSLGSIQ